MFQQGQNRILPVSKLNCVAVIPKCFNKRIPTLDFEFVERVGWTICRVQVRVDIFRDFVPMGILLDNNGLAGNVTRTAFFCRSNISPYYYSAI